MKSVAETINYRAWESLMNKAVETDDEEDYEKLREFEELVGKKYRPYFERIYRGNKELLWALHDISIDYATTHFADWIANYPCVADVVEDLMSCEMFTDEILELENVLQVALSRCVDATVVWVAEMFKNPQKRYLAVQSWAKYIKYRLEFLVDMYGDELMGDYIRIYGLNDQSNGDWMELMQRNVNLWTDFEDLTYESEQVLPKEMVIHYMQLAMVHGLLML